MTAAKRGRFLFCFPVDGAIAFVYERRWADGELRWDSCRNCCRMCEVIVQ